MDWNGNGRKDSFDKFMDMKMVNGEPEGNESHSGCCLFSLALMLTPVILAAAALAGTVMKL